MAEVNAKARAAVEKLYAVKPSAGLDEFIAAAKSADRKFAEGDDRRSFHARYVLPLRRKAAAAKGGQTKRTKRNVAKKSGPGRPRKKVAKKKTGKKRGPGRPRKKITKKRGPGRPRKKATKKKTVKKVTKKRGRPRKREGITAAGFAAVKRLIVSRDRVLLSAANDPGRAYAAASEIDSFVEKLVKTVRSGG